MIIPRTALGVARKSRPPRRIFQALPFRLLYQRIGFELGSSTRLGKGEVRMKRRDFLAGIGAASAAAPLAALATVDAPAFWVLLPATPPALKKPNGGRFLTD